MDPWGAHVDAAPLLDQARLWFRCCGRGAAWWRVLEEHRRRCLGPASAATASAIQCPSATARCRGRGEDRGTPASPPTAWAAPKSGQPRVEAAGAHQRPRGWQAGWVGQAGAVSGLLIPGTGGQPGVHGPWVLGTCHPNQSPERFSASWHPPQAQLGEQGVRCKPAPRVSTAPPPPRAGRSQQWPYSEEALRGESAQGG